MNLFKSRYGKILLILLVFVFAFLYIKGQLNKSAKISIPKTGASYKTLTPGISSKSDAIKEFGAPINGEGSSALLFGSDNPNFPHQVALQEDKVEFIKQIITAKDKENANEIKALYGDPPYILYGEYSASGFNLYVYPDKGIAYIGHPKEGILLEIWYFTPTTIEDFRSKWAKNYYDSPPLRQ